MNLTKGVLLFVIFGLLGYDGFVGILHQPTESQVLRDWGHVSVLLPFCAGFLLGHWFLPRKRPSGSAWGNAAAILFGLAAWDLIWLLQGRTDTPFYRYMGWWALIGIPAGSLLWGQSDDESPLP